MHSSQAYGSQQQAVYAPQQAQASQQSQAYSAQQQAAYAPQQQVVQTETRQWAETNVVYNMLEKYWYDIVHEMEKQANGTEMSIYAKYLRENPTARSDLVKRSVVRFQQRKESEKSEKRTKKKTK